MYGGVLVALVVLVLVGGRLAIVILTAIPLSILIGIGGIYRIGLNFEQISISALILALGMLVDNAIVISENIQRHLNLGFSAFDAAIKGTREVASAVMSATATTIAAFIPMLAVYGASGKFIRSMPLTVMFTLFASYIVAMTATPILSMLILRPAKGGGDHDFARGLNKFGNKYYPVMLRAALKKPTLVILITVGALFGAVALFTLLGKEFFPKANKPVFVVDIRRPVGTNLTSLDSLVRIIEAEIINEPIVIHTCSNIGKGNPVIYYNMGRTREKDHYGQIFVSTDPDQKYEKVYDLIIRLRERWKDYPHARVETREFTQGPPIGAPIAVHVSGEDLEVLRDLTEQVEKILVATEGTENIDNDLTSSGGEIEIRINRDRAGMLGIPQSVIARTIRLALAGEPVTSFRMGDEERDVVVRLPLNKLPGWDDLSKIYLPGAGGNMVPLSEIAEPVITGSASSIAHRDKKRDFAVRSDVKEGYFAADIKTAVIPQLEEIGFPDGYEYNIEGETEERDESFRSLFGASIIALLVIYAILVLQFNSFSQPLVIFTALPMAFIGAILGLYVTRNNFGFMAFVGLESLIGIVINDAIVLLEFVNQKLKEGFSRDGALIEAGKIRFVPILLTSITTIGGLMPLTLFSGKLYAPMGWTMVGGLLFSTVLTLVIVPVLFRLMVKVKQ
jgi:multidrug efflux pump subunit AcrB